MLVSMLIAIAIVALVVIAIAIKRRWIPSDRGFLFAAAVLVLFVAVFLRITD